MATSEPRVVVGLVVELCVLKMHLTHSRTRSAELALRSFGLAATTELPPSGRGTKKRLGIIHVTSRFRP